jgi:hypothetical protein
MATAHSTGSSLTDQERLHKNALCDLLMKEGIDDRQDEDAVARTCSLTTLAIDLGRKDSLARALAWHEVLEQKGISGEQAIILDLSRANAIAGERYGTAWQWDQPTLAREIFYLRRAVSNPQFPQASNVTKCMCLNNLGNRLRVAGRAIEALEYWRCVLEVRPNFGMALCNRARTLSAYGASLEDADERMFFMWMAHKEASAAIAPTALYTDIRDERTRENIKMLKEQIESEIDVAGIAALDPLASQETSATEEERNYRHWCLGNCLFLNPFNDLGPHTVAASDTKGLEGHVVRVDAPHRFDSFFDQMKQEYVSARWLLYEGFTSTIPHFSDREVFLGATEPRPSLSLAIEKINCLQNFLLSFRQDRLLFGRIYGARYPGETDHISNTLADRRKQANTERIRFDRQLGVLCLVLAGQGLLGEGQRRSSRTTGPRT